MFTKIALVAAIAAVAIATAHGAPQSSRVEQRVVLTPKAGTPCMSACDDPASPSCQSCCRTVTHETDWGCQATAGSSTTASCCTGAWDATCWNVASAANNDHACNQCVTKEPKVAPTIPFPTTTQVSFSGKGFPDGTYATHVHAESCDTNGGERRLDDDRDKEIFPEVTCKDVRARTRLFN